MTIEHPGVVQLASIPILDAEQLPLPMRSEAEGSG